MAKFFLKCIVYLTVRNYDIKFFTYDFRIIVQRFFYFSGESFAIKMYLKNTSAIVFFLFVRIYSADERRYCSNSNIIEVIRIRLTIIPILVGGTLYIKNLISIPFTYHGEKLSHIFNR